MTQETTLNQRVEAFSKNIQTGLLYPLSVNTALLVPLAIIALGTGQEPPRLWNNYVAGATGGTAIASGVLFLIASFYDGFGKRSEGHHRVSSAFGKIAGIALPTLAAVAGALVFNAINFMGCSSCQAKAPVPVHAPHSYNR